MFSEIVVFFAVLLLPVVDSGLPGLHSLHCDSSCTSIPIKIQFLQKFYISWNFLFLFQQSGHTYSDKPGKALLIVLLVLLAIITLLLCTIDRIYSPWIMSFVKGKIFSYCVQVATLITLTVGACYLFATLTMGLCSTSKKQPTSPNSGGPSVRFNNEPVGTPTTENNASFANPCYDIEFCLYDPSSKGGNQGVSQV